MSREIAIGKSEFGESVTDHHEMPGFIVTDRGPVSDEDIT